MPGPGSAATLALLADFVAVAEELCPLTDDEPAELAHALRWVHAWS